jgi:hypothetical protein
MESFVEKHQRKVTGTISIFDRLICPNRKRQSARIGRLLLLLRAHFIAKIPRSRRYRVTLRGFKLMTAAIFLREEYMPNYILA